MLLPTAFPAAAGASSWPAAGGGPARTAAQEIQPGDLPVTVAWSFESATLATPAIVTGAADPFGQRVAYGTTDGRVHLRSLATGAEIGPAGGTLVADATVTDSLDAFASPFVSSSTDTEAGLLYVVHDDGSGVEVARFDEVTGQRIGFDVALSGGLGCDEAGAPLLTPPASDGTRLLFFTITGPCTAGEGLVRLPVEADGTLGAPKVGRVDDPAADPVLLVADDRYLVAVGRNGGIDLFAADGDLSSRHAAVELGADEATVAVANDAGELLALTTTDTGARLSAVRGRRVVASADLPGTAVGLAVGAQRIAVATSTGLHVLRRDLSTALTVPGSGSAPAVAGSFAFQDDRAVRLEDGAVSELPPSTVAPALARGLVVSGPLALATTDLVPPTVSASRGLAAAVADDRGVAAVRFTVAGRQLVGRTKGSSWAPARYEADPPGTLAPGRHRVVVRATDLAGNIASAGARLRVGCERRRAGGPETDRLRGSARRDCLDVRGGDDRVAVAGGGADRVRCGSGVDRVQADRADRVAHDCERVTRWAGR